jgi:hypothetical protein
LLDPPGAVRREATAGVGVEFLGGLHQADVALGDEVLQRKPAIRVHLGHGHDEPQVGANHVFTGRAIAALNAAAERLFLLRVQERHFVDLLEICLQAAFGGNGRLLWAGRRRDIPVEAPDQAHPSTAQEVDLEPARTARRTEPGR